MFGHLKIVELLLKCGADMNLTPSLHSGPLYAACYRNDYNVVERLIKYGAGELELKKKKN